MRKSTSTAIPWTILILLGLAIRFVESYWYVVVPIVVLVIILAICSHAENERRVKALSISGIDNMDGIDFEHYVKRLMENLGYSAQVTTASSDYGIDIIAKKGNDRYAVQVKRYKSNVSRKAVSDAVAGMAYYGCNKSMVVTNSYFSENAKEMAAKTNTILIDRADLSDWILRFQNS